MFRDVAGRVFEMWSPREEHKKAIIEGLEKAWAAEVAKDDKPFKRIPKVNKWKQSYKKKRRRYKFLVLDGDSMFGKSAFATSLYGEAKTVLIDCSGGQEPDGRGYDFFTHQCIIFDEMPLRSVIKHKRLLQAPCKAVNLGSSTTQMYAYKMFVAGKAMIVTTNHFEEEFCKLSPTEKKWIVKNMVYYKVDTHLYEDHESSDSNSDAGPWKKAVEGL